MVKITIVHAPKRCPKCERTEQIARQVAAQFPGLVDIQLLSIEAVPPELGVVMPPTVLVDDVIVSGGAIPRKSALLAAVSASIGGARPRPSGATDPSAFGHGRAAMEGDLVYVCAEDFPEDTGCEPMMLFWHVDEGERVAKGQELAEIESAKAVFVIESPVAGTLEAILVREGQRIEPNQRLAEIKPNPASKV